MENLIAIIEDRAQFIVPTAVVLIGYVIVTALLNRSDAKFPHLGKELGNSEQRRKAYLKGAVELYRQGYAKFKDTAYRITTVDGDRIVVPPSALEELRRLPDDVINNQVALSKAVEAHYTGVAANVDSELLNHVVRADLTQSLSRINPRLAQEVARSVDEVLGSCEDWTPLMIYQKILRIVAIVSGHVFLGPDLCRREEYLYASINYTVDVFKAVRKLKEWNSWLRPIARFFTPELKQIQVHKKKARDFLIPIIRERREAMRAGKKDLPDDMLQWTINKADKFKATDEALADLQLTLSMAAIHTTTLQTTDVLGELAIRPELVNELRDEVRCVMAENDGAITTHALFEMKLLDSVMRETQRVNPLNQARFSRYVNKPITLKSGLHLPAGHMIETPHGAVVSDPALYPSPETFDAHRFARLRRDGAVPDPIRYRNREQYQFVAVTKENMAFGFGAHACPGRFFAANEIKLILARMLLRYDVRFPGGVTGMSPRIMVGSSSQTNPMAKMEFRKVKEGDLEKVQQA